MDLFSITCDSCTSRLKVRQLSAIGQILACPKCGSMLQVEPPDGWERPEALSPPAEAAADRAAQPSGAEFDDVGALLASPSPPGTGVRTIPQPPVAGDEPLLPNDQWTSEATQHRRKMLTLFALATIVLVVAITLLLMLTGQLIPDRQTAESNPQTGEQSVSPADSTGQQTEPRDDAKADPPNDQRQSDQSADATASAAESENSDPETGSEAAVASDPPSDNSGAGPGNEVVPAPVVNEPVLDTARQPPDFPDADPPAITQQALSIFDGLGDLPSLIEDVGVSPDDVQQAIAEDTSESIGIGTLYIAKPAPSEVDVSRQLEAEVGGIRYKTSLPNFLRLMTKISGVPFAIDADALRAAGVNVDADVEADTTEASIMAIVQGAVEPLGLQLIADQHGVLITSAAKGQLIEATYDLSPFESLSPDELNRLADFIRDSIAPSTWDSQGGPAFIRVQDRKLIVNQVPETQYDIRMILNKLNAARQLVNDPVNQPALEATATASSRSHSVRQTITELNQIQAAPIADVLGQLADRYGVAVILDWPELFQQGWFPETEIPWPDEDSTFEKTLRRVTRAMGLDYRVIGDNAFEITSQLKAQTELEVEVYPLAGITNDHRSGEQIVKLLQSTIQQSFPRDSGAFVIFEPKCNCILAYLPQVLQIRTERLLDQLRPSP